MEYMGEKNLMNITRGAGMPLKVDQRTQRYGPYTRVQVDVDCFLELTREGFGKEEKSGVRFFCKYLL